jgi:NAD+ synthase
MSPPILLLQGLGRTTYMVVENNRRMRPKLRDEAEPVIIDFIRQKVEESGGNGVVVGLSGELDSAVVATLSAKAVGPERVLAIHMPSETSSPRDLRDSRELSELFGFEFKVTSIAEPVSAFSQSLPSPERRDLMGNVMARCRMITLFHHANMLGRVVMGTGNKSELLVGYFTKFGDGGSDFLPIGDLYKTEVRELAMRIGIPTELVEKPCSAGLWEGQTDEGEMGCTYENLDRILQGFEMGLTHGSIVSQTGLDKELVGRIWDMYLSSVHKRKMPLIPKIGIRTVGLDWRE